MQSSLVRGSGTGSIPLTDQAPSLAGHTFRAASQVTVSNRRAAMGRNDDRCGRSACLRKRVCVWQLRARAARQRSSARHSLAYTP